MAIAVVYRPPAITAEQYNTSWSGSDGPPLPVPPGLLFHAGVGMVATFSQSLFGAPERRTKCSHPNLRRR